MKTLIVLLGLMSALDSWALPMVCEGENFTVTLEKFQNKNCDAFEAENPDTSGTCVRAIISEAGNGIKHWILILHGSDAFDHYPKPRISQGHYFYEILMQDTTRLGIAKFSWKYGNFPRASFFYDKFYLTLEDESEIMVYCDSSQE